MKAKFKPIKITKEFLDQNPNSFFVFGDNSQRVGADGASALRGHPKAIGFITKKTSNNNPSSFFKVDEYIKPFFEQLNQLVNHIQSHPNYTFYISKIGSGLANYYYIWEKLIGHNLVEDLKDFENVVFCWEQEEEYTEQSKLLPFISVNQLEKEMSPDIVVEESNIKKLTNELNEANAIIKSQQDTYMREIMRLTSLLAEHESEDGCEHGRYTRAAADCDSA
jgi:hypothetical protein